MRAEGKVAFASGTIPEWVKEWLGRRRGPGVSTGKPADEEAEKTSSKDEASASTARERNRTDREAAILAGLDDLDIWLTDQTERGMAAFVTQCHTECRALAQRLIVPRPRALRPGWSRFRRGSSRYRKPRDLLPR